MITRLILVRHGQTAWNGASIFQGHRDSPLTTQGINQARALGVRLARMKIAVVYSSDLGRARETAQLITSFTGHSFSEDPRFRERALGIFEGLSREEAARQFPTEYEHYTSGNADYTVPRGESAKGRFFMALAGFNELAGKHAGHNIVVVSHGGVVQGMFRHVTGLGFSAQRRFSLHNGAYNSFIQDDNGEWLLESWGDISHLSERIATLEPGDAPAETASEFSFTP